MALKDAELAGIDKLLARMEKAANLWRIQRWPMVGVGLLWVGIAVWLFMLMLRAQGAAIPIDHDREITRVDLLLERQMVMNSCVVYISAIVHGCLSGWMFVYTFANWNKGRRDSLLVKLARSYLDERRANAQSPS